MMAMGSVLLLSALSSGDDDDSYALALSLYQMNSLYNEQTDMLPVIGWYKTIVQTKQYLAPGESNT